MWTSYKNDILPGWLDDAVVLPVAASVVHVARDLDGGVGRVADVVVPHSDIVVPGNLGGHSYMTFTMSSLIKTDVKGTTYKGRLRGGGCLKSGNHSRLHELSTQDYSASSTKLDKAKSPKFLQTFCMDGPKEMLLASRL